MLNWKMRKFEIVKITRVQSYEFIWKLKQFVYSNSTFRQTQEPTMLSYNISPADCKSAGARATSSHFSIIIP